eukprot:jgi/Chrzof1/5388/Cz16g01020.t1
MNEAQAAAYYDDVKAKGAAAHQQKRGLGYSGPPAGPPPPSSAPQEATSAAQPTGTTATSAQPAPAHYPMTSAAAPSKGPPPAGGYWRPPGPAPHVGAPPSHFPPPPGPGMILSRPHMQVPPGVPPPMVPGTLPGAPPMHPPRPPTFGAVAPGPYPMMMQHHPLPLGAHPPQQLAVPPRPPVPPGLPPGVPPPRPMQAFHPHPGYVPGGSIPPPHPHFMPHQQPGMPPPPRPPFGLAPPPHPSMQAGNYPRPTPAPLQPAPPSHLDEDPAAALQRMEQEAAAAAEEAAQKLAAERERLKQKNAEEDKARAAAGAWTAHKTDDGQVYYYNTVSGASSWERPATFRGDEEAVAEQPVPVAQAPVSGTDWMEVKCHDGRRYYFNTTTEETDWTVPDEVTAAKKKQLEEAAAAAARARQAAAEQRAAAMNQLVRGAPRPSGTGFGAGAYDAEAARIAHIQSAMAARKGSGFGAGMSQEARLTGFKALLLEAGVNGFSFWDKVKPKLEKDDRWNLLPSNKERRVAFDEFCKNIAEEQKKLKVAKEAAAIEGFRQLMDEAADVERQLRVSMLKADWAARHQQQGGKDDSEEGENQEDLPSSEPPPDFDQLQISDEDLDLSLEQLEKYWGNDERWSAATAEQRGKLFHARFGAAMEAVAARRQAEQQQREADYRALLRELKVTSTSRWSLTKADMADHPAAEQLPPDQREKLFRAYVAELQEQEAKLAAAAAEEQARVEEAERRLAEQGEEATRRRRRAAHADAVAGFNTLLAEMVRDPEAVWEECRDRLKKDAQGRGDNPSISPLEYERIFDEHVRGLAAAATATMRLVLEELLRPLMPGETAAATAGDNQDAAAGSSQQAVAAVDEAEKKQLLEQAIAKGSLHPALRRYDEACLILDDDARWLRGSDAFREAVWQDWISEVVWGRPPATFYREGGGNARHHSAAGPQGTHHDDVDNEMRAAGASNSFGRSRSPPGRRRPREDAGPASYDRDYDHYARGVNGGNSYRQGGRAGDRGQDWADGDRRVRSSYAGSSRASDPGEQDSREHQRDSNSRGDRFADRRGPSDRIPDRRGGDDGDRRREGRDRYSATARDDTHNKAGRNAAGDTSRPHRWQDGNDHPDRGGSKTVYDKGEDRYNRRSRTDDEDKHRAGNDDRGRDRPGGMSRTDKEEGRVDADREDGKRARHR